MCCWIWFSSWILFIYISSCRTWLFYLIETRGWQLTALLELYLIKVTHALLYLGSRLWFTQTRPCCSLGGGGGAGVVLSNSAKCCECLSERPLTTSGWCPPFHHHGACMHTFRICRTWTPAATTLLLLSHWNHCHTGSGGGCCWCWPVVGRTAGPARLQRSPFLSHWSAALHRF